MTQPDPIKAINSETQLYAVIGCPVEHSVSPYLHNSIRQVTGRNFVYCAFRVEQEKLEDAIRGMRALGIKGFNVTVPHKEQVMRYLDWISPEARLIGAVNTVVNCSGQLLGYNTDADGLIKAIQETGFDWQGKNILILGAGGTARAAGYAAFKAGAAAVCYCNRTGEKASLLAEKFADVLAGSRGTGYFSWTTPEEEAFPQRLQEADLVINTTSAGMAPQEQLMPIPAHVSFRKNQMVFDVIYKPSRTLLLQKAEAEGCRVANGMGMLFYQGIRASEIWRSWEAAGWKADFSRALPEELHMGQDEIAQVKGLFLKHIGWEDF